MSPKHRAASLNDALQQLRVESPSEAAWDQVQEKAIASLSEHVGATVRPVGVPMRSSSGLSVQVVFETGVGPIQTVWNGVLDCVDVQSRHTAISVVLIPYIYDRRVSAKQGDFIEVRCAQDGERWEWRTLGWMVDEHDEYEAYDTIESPPVPDSR